MSIETKRFRNSGAEESPVQVASAKQLEMALPQRSQETLASGHQLLMGNNELLSSFGNGVNVPSRRITPASCGAAIPQTQVKNLVAALVGSLECPPTVKRPRYHIVHLASEMAPVAKVGGLGDVVTGLGRALQKKHHRVEIIIPKYKTLDMSGIKNFKKLNKHFYSYFEGAEHENMVWTGVVEGLRVFFIDPLHPAEFFNRGGIYCEPDDFKRFTYFSRASLEFLLQFGKRPHLIHCHDWPVAVVAPLCKSIYSSAGLTSKLAFTCHNFEPQGKESMEALTSCGLQFQAPLHTDHFQDNISADRINVLKGGLVHSDFVTTVSPTYAKEVLTPEGGEGLHTTLRAMTKKFYGVVNGIDDTVWNPATDPHLEEHFSMDDLKGKEVLKNKLRLRLGLANLGIDAKRPLVCCVSRLVPQKGVHLLRSAIFHTLNRGGQFILQGTSQDPVIKKDFDELAQQFENHPHVRLVLRYEETLTHNIYGAADIFVIPSIFEPCGLTQMYSMRYGTIPVVRKTGGLADSVFDVDQKHAVVEKRNGFTFSEPTEEALASALDRALLYYKEHPDWWKALVSKVMRIDMSWDAAPIDQYIKLYEHTVQEGHPPASIS
ncbi:probable starch synthase 4, chloroplastic/amyloplastic [Physcomitrium patens]|uniref:Starch synthase, chloroplastic/amyloplastic n=1 Tax=Physcomitrium patens TaxID=3218 RepID=A0A7I4EHW4_PHYPA|nr:probable starch synthase 4, chloroplastic/amyloplastic [Physcomitrium patens]|eukprot:XP_024384226.1 probable starch synthase 4, chloroplastic/amyloplastic [Physcomitrella patens]